MDILSHFYSLVKQIPEGRVSTYGEIARGLGDIRVARAVGKMLHHNMYAPVVPCHRVVMSDGGLGGFATGTENKIALLKIEGVEVAGGRVVEFKDLRFSDFRSEEPLKRLVEEQARLSGKVVTEDRFNSKRIVAAVDVAYIEDIKKDTQTAIGAMVIWDNDEHSVIDTHTTLLEISFPYIPTYLSYREFPVIEKLVRERPNFDILVVDGNGVLHPRGIGLASHAGVTLERPAIGVAKGLIKGELRETGMDGIREVFMDGREAGFSVRSSARAKRPIFVSPGHLVSFKTALELMRSMCSYRLPEPLRLAHIEAGKARKEHCQGLGI